MKKFAVIALLVAMVAAMTAPSFAWDASKQKTLGQDQNKMTWYLLDYGKDSNGVPFAQLRKYYTNATIKNETVELLMSKFGLSPEVAGSLYFTEYGYEYTEDGKQFAMTYLKHYDMLGNEIHGTVYDGSTEATAKNFVAVPAGSKAAQAAPYAIGKPVTTSQPAQKKASSTVPAKRVVRSTKKK